MELNQIYNADCITFMGGVSDDAIDLTLTDIPYSMRNMKSNRLRKLDKGKADILTFDIADFLENVYRITKGTIIIFCGQGQLSQIFNFFLEKQKKHKGTVRQLVWEKCLDGNEMVFIKNNQTNIVSRMYLKDVYRNNPNLLSVWNGQTWVQIFDIKESIHMKYKEIVLRNGHVIKCSNEHKFYIQNKEVEAQELKVGDVLDHVSLPNDVINSKDNYEIIEIKDKTNTTNKKFYDIQLENDPHQYCLYDGILTHNCNPSPMNGDYIYLSGIENAIWFKKHGGTFNAHCKSNVFKYPCGRSKLHPTEKNHGLLKELILDNSNEGDLVFDPCAGSGSHLLVAKENNRNFLGTELDTNYYNLAKERIESL